MPAITLRSTAGALVGRHDPPEGEPPAAGPRAAVICHPHPQHGGTLDNKVVYALAKTCVARGLHAVRFNFRGAGGSEGAFAEGAGEADDARAAIAWAGDLVAGPEGAPAGSLLVAGYSFGAWVAARAAGGDPRVGARLLVAPPVNFYGFEAAAVTGPPLAVVYARADELVPADAVEAWLADLPSPPQVTAVDGAGHLFHGHLAAVRGAVGQLLDGFGPGTTAG